MLYLNYCGITKLNLKKNRDLKSELTESQLTSLFSFIEKYSYIGFQVNTIYTL
jgi:hypothetical protein